VLQVRQHLASKELFQITSSQWKGEVIVNILIAVPEDTQHFDNVWVGFFLDGRERMILS
jgi:hypothetical protein